MSREAPFHCNTEEWKRRFGDLPVHAALTIGNFDGMHLGHQKILETVNEWVSSKETLNKKPEQLLATALTFYPHPAKVLRPAEAPPLLCTLPQRLAAFENAGMNAALVLKFDEQLAKVSAEDFARRSHGRRVALVGPAVRASGRNQNRNRARAQTRRAHA